MQRFTGRDYLAIDIANNFGLDKKTWNERLAWFEQNKGNLHSLVNQADDPALFYAGVKTWEAVQQGLPIGYCISLDATSSGLQILAALSGDRSAAQLCNVVSVSPLGSDEPMRYDAYTAVYQTMLEALGGESKIKREDCKTAIMTAFYGSKAEPKRVFGEGQQLAVFEQTMATLAPGCWELNEAFLALWDDTATSYAWTLPDNFHVRTKVMTTVGETVQFLNEPFDVTRKVNAPVKEGRSLGANTIHSLDGMIVREMTRRCSYDPAWIDLIRNMLDDEIEFRFDPKQRKENEDMVQTLWGHYVASGYLSARILDHLDSDTLALVDAEEIRALVDSLPAKPFQVFSVHDCFKCLPTYGNDLRWQYILQLHLIAKSDLLSFLLSQITGRRMPVGKLDPTLAADVLKTEYALS